jgi:phospholipid/cholesterol/gamma-HCH transport system substrate-binding protein
MKRFRERNRAVTGLISIVVVLTLVAGALEFSKLPLIHNTANFSADFANAASLVPSDIVTVYGVKVGQINGLKLDGAQVKVDFTVRQGVRLGSMTTAEIEVLSPIGTEYIQLVPAGTGHLSGTIPLFRTTVPYTLVGDLSKFGNDIENYNIPNIEKSFEASAADFNGTSVADTVAAFNGLARFSEILGNQSAALATIVSQGSGLAQVLSQRSGELFDLVSQGAIVLNTLEQRRSAIQALLAATTTFSQHLTSLLQTNSAEFGPVLSSLDSVSAILAQDSNDIGQAIPVLAAFSRYAANATGNGPFADASIPTLLVPDNLFAQCAAKGAFPSTNPEVGCRP